MRPDGRPSGPRRPEQARVFFALWPDEPVRQALHRAAVDAAKRFGGRATRAETLHLTLAFIGDVALDRLPALHEAAAGVECEAFAMRIDRLGFWGHNRILWAGTSQPQRRLGELVGQLGARLQAIGHGGAADAGRPFAPHVTLVRNVGDKRPELPALPQLEWACARFVLVRSRLSAAGSAYETLGQWPLR